MLYKKLIFIFTIFLLIFSSSLMAGNINYQYDELNRLIQVEYPNGTILRYTYDAVGNRQSKYFIVLNISDQIITSGTYKAQSIVAGPNVTIAQGSEVIFEAESSISAGNNFTIEENAQVTFKAASITSENNFIIKSGAVVIFEASDWIIAGPNFIIESGAQVYFKAGSFIRLLNEFTANVGSLFDAIIQ